MRSACDTRCFPERGHCPVLTGANVVELWTVVSLCALHTVANALSSVK